MVKLRVCVSDRGPPLDHGASVIRGDESLCGGLNLHELADRLTDTFGASPFYIKIL